MEEKVIDIEELAQDGHNFNKGNDVRAPFTQGGGLRRGCGKMVGHLGKILAKKSVQIWPNTNYTN